MISCTVLSFLASSCATCSKASFILSKAHSVAFTSALKVPLYSSQSPLFRAMKAFLHDWFVAIRIMAAFHLFQVFFGWPFQLPLALSSCLFLFVSPFSKPSYSCSFLKKIFPHSTCIWFFSDHSTNPSTVRLFLHDLSPLHICQQLFSFGLQRLVATSLA